MGTMCATGIAFKRPPLFQYLFDVVFTDEIFWRQIDVFK